MRNERGAAVVVLCAFVVALLAVTAVVSAVTRVAVARTAASSAADLAALAAVEGGCQQALTVAQANAATLLRCDQVGADVIVEVGRSVQLAGQHRQVRASARAGPP